MQPDENKTLDDLLDEMRHKFAPLGVLVANAIEVALGRSIETRLQLAHDCDELRKSNEMLRMALDQARHTAGAKPDEPLDAAINRLKLRAEAAEKAHSEAEAKLIVIWKALKVTA